MPPSVIDNFPSTPGKVSLIFNYQYRCPLILLWSNLVDFRSCGVYDMRNVFEFAI